MSARQRWLIAAGVLVAAAALAYVSFGRLGENLVYYWTPGEALQKIDQARKSTIRLGGVVVPGSVVWDAKALKLQFKVADSDKIGAAAVLVDSSGTPPQMFREKIGVVVEGTFDQASIFHSDRLMVNHSNEYRPPTEAEIKSGYGADSLTKK